MICDQIHEALRWIGNLPYVSRNTIFDNFIEPISYYFNCNLDTRSFKNITLHCGYEYEKIECVTKDGCILDMDRVANSNSYKVVYFQHGYMDTSLSWVLHGQADSIAFVAADSDHLGEGFDVFAGNLRGIYPWK